VNNDGVFVYYGSRWYNETDEKSRYKLTRYISENLYNDLKDLIDDAVELTTKQTQALEQSLRSSTSNGGTFKDIVRHLLSVKSGENADIKFDNNPFLLGFENGVVDLPTATFREYRFDDYITLTTKYNYKKPEANAANSEAKKTLESFFATIQPDPAHLTLLYQVLCSALDGINYQKFWFYNGKGGNGKGVISRLMRALLGDNFCYCPKEELLKEVGRNNGASPDIADLQFKRYVIFTEMGGTIKLTSFRRLTGGDQLTGRQLHQGNIHFYLNATLVGEFNNPPEFDAKAMEADYRRAVDFGFKVNFTDDPAKINKTVNGVSYLEADPYYSSDRFVEEHSSIFLEILLEKYKESYSSATEQIHFTIPDDIRRASIALVDSTNVFKQIVEELYEEGTDSEPIPAKEIWNDLQLNEKYKSLSKLAKRQYNMNGLYDWLSCNYTTSFQNGVGTATVVKGIKRRSL
jgi:phage/plasmid-associated DNA primase